MDFNAITLDTSILKGENFNLENGLLAKFDQFSGNSNILFIMSDIVYQEMFFHMVDDTKEVISSYLKSLKKGLFYRIDENITSEKIKSMNNIDIEHLVNLRIKEYTSKTGLQIIPADNINIANIISRYFNKIPPFSEKKKNEFPDAIALQSLENWAKKYNKKVLVISCDKDWQKYCEQSKELCYVKTIKDALSLLYKDNDFVQEQLENMLSSNVDVVKSINNFIFENEYKLSIMFSASSFCGYQNVDDIDYNLINFSFETLKDKIICDILKIKENEITVLCPIELEFHIEGKTPIYFYDREEDADYPMAMATINDDINVKNSLIIKFNSSEYGLSVKDASLTKEYIEVDLGCLQPDQELDE